MSESGIEFGRDWPSWSGTWCFYSACVRICFWQQFLPVDILLAVWNWKRMAPWYLDQTHLWWFANALVSVPDAFWLHINMCECFYRFALFLKDNLGDCFKENVSKSLYMFLPAVFHIVMAVWISYTVSYQEQRAVVFLLLNFSLANSTLDLMLVNMAKKKFRLF